MLLSRERRLLPVLFATAAGLLSACSDSAAGPGGASSTAGSTSDFGSSTGDVEPPSGDSTTAGSDETGTDETGTDETVADVQCGDGQVDGGEVCDDGINDGRSGGCQPGCGAWAPACGDGNVDEGEACDDGNMDDGDGCNVGCVASGAAMWTVSMPGWNLLDMVRPTEGGVRIALSDADFEVDTLSLRTLDLDGDVAAEVVLDDVRSGAAVDLHESGRFVVQRGNYELASYGDQGTALWTFELPFFDPITTRRFSRASGDGGAFFGLRDFQGDSLVAGADQSGIDAWETELVDRLMEMDVTPSGAMVTLTSPTLGNEMTVTSYGQNGGVEFDTDLPALIDAGIITASTAGIAVCWRRQDGIGYGAAKLSSGGMLEWSGSYGGPGPSGTMFLDVAVLDDGDLVVLEVQDTGLFGQEVVVRRISEGRSVWETVLDVLDGRSGRVLEDAEGKLLVGVTSFDATTLRRLEP